MMSGTVDMNSEKLSGKPFFRIGEVSAITKVSISDLRMWEAEFSRYEAPGFVTGKARQSG